MFLCKNGRASPQPKFVEVSDGIMCDIFPPPAVETRLGRYIELRREGGEFENTTADCTVKPMPPLVGEIGHNRRCAREISQAAPHAEQLRSVNLVGGASGSALMVDAMLSGRVVAAGVMYRGDLRRNREVLRSISAQIAPSVYYSRRCARFPPSYNAAHWGRPAWLWQWGKRPGKGKINRPFISERFYAVSIRRSMGRCRAVFFTRGLS